MGRAVSLEKEAVITAYLETRSIRKSAARLGVSHELVRQHLHEYGMPMRYSRQSAARPRPRFCQHCDTEIPYRKTDYPWRYRQKRFCSQRCVGLSGARTGRTRKLTNAVVMDAYRRAPNAYQAARALQVAPNTVYRQLREMGVDFKDKAG